MTNVVRSVNMDTMFSPLGLMAHLTSVVRPTRYRIECLPSRGEVALRRRCVDRAAAVALRALCGAW